ncbi:hypothetical protein [Alkaliphilus crotonatoxidans]
MIFKRKLVALVVCSVVFITQLIAVDALVITDYSSISTSKLTGLAITTPITTLSNPDPEMD